jgi:hypothetical protein
LLLSGAFLFSDALNYAGRPQRSGECNREGAAAFGACGLGIPLANPKMSDKLQFVVAFGSGRVVETSDKLKFVGHFQRILALLSNSPAVSLGTALAVISNSTDFLDKGLEWAGPRSLLQNQSRLPKRFQGPADLI